MHSSNPIIIIITVAVTVAHARDNVHGRSEGTSTLKITEENCDIKASKHVEDLQVSINPRHTKPINTLLLVPKRVAYI